MYQPDQSKQFGKAIKQLLQDRGLSQRKFAKQAGLETDYVSKLMNGKIAEPRTEARAKIAKGFNLTISELQAAIQRLNSDQAETGDQSSTPLSSQDSEINLIIEQLRAQQTEDILNNYGKIRLINGQRIEVNHLYVDVYILEHPSANRIDSIPGMMQSFDIEEDRFGMSKREEDRQPGFDVANQHEHLVVSGKPGSGKSTFLRHLAIACCNQEFQNDRVPVLIELRSIESTYIEDSNGFDLERFLQIKAQWTLDNLQFQHLLKDGKLLLLLDGLDEIAERFIPIVKKGIQLFCRTHYKNQIILTCRTNMLEHVPDGFDCVEVADFTPKQVRKFVLHWFIDQSKSFKKGSSTAKILMRNLRRPEHSQTAELSSTPILLSLICWVFQDQSDFPKDQADLYRRGVELLLGKWDKQRGIQREFISPIYRDLSIESKQNLLGSIAFHKLQKDNIALFEQHEIQDNIAQHLKISPKDSLEVLRSIEVQHGLLVERASEIYSFLHLTFQEYFAARWVCNSGNWEDIKSAMTQNRLKEILSIAFTLQNADRIAQMMKAEVDHLLANDPQLQKFLSWIDSKAQSVQSCQERYSTRAFYFRLSSYPYNYKLNLGQYPNESDREIDVALAVILANSSDLANSQGYDHNDNALKPDSALDSDVEICDSDNEDRPVSDESHARAVKYCEGIRSTIEDLSAALDRAKKFARCVRITPKDLKLAKSHARNLEKFYNRRRQIREELNFQIRQIREEYELNLQPMRQTRVEYELNLQSMRQIREERINNYMRENDERVNAYDERVNAYSDFLWYEINRKPEREIDLELELHKIKREIEKLMREREREIDKLMREREREIGDLEISFSSDNNNFSSSSGNKNSASSSPDNLNNDNIDFDLAYKYFIVFEHIESGFNQDSDLKSNSNTVPDGKLTPLRGIIGKISPFKGITDAAEKRDGEKRLLENARNLGLNLDNIRNYARRHHNYDSELDQKLKELRHQLSLIRPNFHLWWQQNAQSWREQLRQAMIQHRNIGHDWQFSDQQKKQLKQYYDTNLLLRDCLRLENNKVSPERRQMIEDSLFLPTTTSE
jgi:transcriptional regulator with XRE-family HTH domain/energy-coupling factor transporter ATP-binding protein EcfA2